MSETTLKEYLEQRGEITNGFKKSIINAELVRAKILERNKRFVGKNVLEGLENYLDIDILWGSGDTTVSNISGNTMSRPSKIDKISLCDSEGKVCTRRESSLTDKNSNILAYGEIGASILIDGIPPFIGNRCVLIADRDNNQNNRIESWTANNRYHHGGSRFGKTYLNDNMTQGSYEKFIQEKSKDGEDIILLGNKNLENINFINIQISEIANMCDISLK